MVNPLKSIKRVLIKNKEDKNDNVKSSDVKEVKAVNDKNFLKPLIKMKGLIYAESINGPVKLLIDGSSFINVNVAVSKDDFKEKFNVVNRNYVNVIIGELLFNELKKRVNDLRSGGDGNTQQD